MSHPKLTPASLPTTGDGSVVYHLAVAANMLANNILIVGDPERVPVIAAAYLDKVEFDVSHRGLRTITGVTKPIDGKTCRMSITTSGMGQPSLEIVLNEIVACNEINLKEKAFKEKWGQINIIRVGTSGALQKDTELGTPIISKYAIGMDNTGLFYDFPYADDTVKTLEEDAQKLIDSLVTSDRFKDTIKPYASAAHPDVVNALANAGASLGVQFKEGITVSCSGFFANQGRAMSRSTLTLPDFDDKISKGIKVGDVKPENMEMETSFLLHFMNSLGYRAGAICATIAHRPSCTFAKDTKGPVEKAFRMAVHALITLANDGKN